MDDSSGDESDGRDSEADEGDICDDGENSDKFGMGFEYDDQYMSISKRVGRLSHLILIVCHDFERFLGDAHK